MKVTYNMAINAGAEDTSYTVHALTIEGSRKKRRKEFGKYLKAAYGINNPRHVARKMGFKDLM